MNVGCLFNSRPESVGEDIRQFTEFYLTWRNTTGHDMYTGNCESTNHYIFLSTLNVSLWFVSTTWSLVIRFPTRRHESGAVTKFWLKWVENVKTKKTLLRDSSHLIFNHKTSTKVHETHLSSSFTILAKR